MCWKSSPGAEIVEAVRSTARGEPVLSRNLAAQLVDIVHASPEKNGTDRSSEIALTTRETEILKLVAAGKENSQIATELYVSPHTVKNHVANILGKLQLENRIQAAVHAVRAGIVSAMIPAVDPTRFL